MQYIQLQSQAAGATPTPGEGKFNFFIDEVDGLPKIKDDNGTIITVDGSTQTLTSLTYEAFIELIMNNELTKGYFYEINDYETCYDQPDFNANGNAITTGNYKTSGEIEPIIVFATASNQIATEAFQAAYPKDKIKYDWTFGVTEVTASPAKGRIIERIDEFNNRTDYDHRNILFKRYNMYYPTQELVGTLNINNGTVMGIGTTFTSLSTGERIYIHDSGLEYMITAIADDTNMTVTGITYNNSNGSRFSRTSSITGYKRNNTTDPATFEEHYTFDLNNDDDNEYINNYIGNYANLREWDDNSFYLANNVFIGGDYINNKIGDNSYNNTFDDDCDNNVIGAGFYNNTTNDDFDDNIIGENFHSNIITSEFDNNRIGSDFYDNIIICDEDFDDNQIGTDFYGNLIACDDFYRNQIGNDFNGNRITGGDDFQNNVIGNQFNDNIITREFIKNRIGNGFNANEILVEFEDNIIGNGFNNNDILRDTSGNGYFNKNEIGHYFNENNIIAQFVNNKIGNDFHNNTIQDAYDSGNYVEFTDNIIGYSFSNNNIDVTFNNNRIGLEFNNNTISYDENTNGYFENNIIGNTTYGNGINGYFDHNQIGNGFTNNDTNGRFSNNNIGNYFDDNETQDEFSHNRIGNNFYQNIIGEYFGYGYDTVRGNVIGNRFQNNTTRNHFYDNNICDGFIANTTPVDFQYNDIKYPVENVDFTVNNRNISTFSRNSPTSTQDGTYSVLGGTSSVLGGGALFEVQVTGGTIQNVVLTSPGYDYSVNETITISAGLFNGSADLVITVLSVTSQAMVTSDYNCKISKSPSDGGILLISTETLTGLYTQSEITEIYLD
jgi:hypothetical protein